MTPTLFFLPVFAGVVILTALFIFVLFQTQHHPTKYTFLGLILCLQTLLYTLFFRYYPVGQPEAVPFALRAQWIAGLLAAVLLFQLGSYFLPGPPRSWLRFIRIASYTLSLILGLVILGTDVIVTGFVMREDISIRVVSPVFSPGGGAVAFWGLLHEGGLLALLHHAMRRSASRLEHIRARRMAAAAWGFLAYGLLNLVALTLSRFDGSLAAVGLYLADLTYVFMVAMGLALGYVVLKYGLPAPVTLDASDLSYAVAWTPPVLMLGWIAYQIDKLALTRDISPWLMPPLTAGLLVGAMLVRPKRETRSRRLGPTSSTARTTGPDAPLREIWAGVVQGQVDTAAVAQLLAALQAALGPTFVILARRADEQLDGTLAFAPALVLEAHPGEMNPRVERITLQGLSLDHALIRSHPVWGDDPGFDTLSPAHLRPLVGMVCPISQLDDWEGLLLVGQANHGGAYTNEQIDRVMECAEAVSAAWTVAWLQEEQRRWRGAAWPQAARARLPGEAGAATIIRIETLGEFKITVHEAPLADSPFVSRRARTLLAYLLWAGERGASREQLSAMLWPSFDPARARNALNVTIHYLRRALEPDIRQPKQSRYLLYETGRYLFNRREAVWIDAEDFERLCAAGVELLGRGEAQRGIETLQQAVALYRGDYLSDPDLDLPAEVEQTRHALRRQFGEACYAAAQATAALGMDDSVEGFLNALIRVDPWDLRAYRILAEHHANRGRHGLAKRHLDLLAAREADLAGSR